MAVMKNLYDGLQNVVAGLGTGRDKAAMSSYAFQPMTDAELSGMYRTSATAQKVVDLPAEDSVREWREWQATASEIERLEVEEARHDVLAKVLKARQMARLFGGAAIYIGTSDVQQDQPLNPERIRAGGVEFLTVLKRSDLNAGQEQRDPRLPNYGMPEFYTLSKGTSLRIHPSRLVIFRGKTILDDTLAGDLAYWGDSVLAATLDSVRNLDSTMANVASLVFEAKVDVFKIPGLMASLANGGAEYEQNVLRRLTLAATAKGINGALLMDGDENYEQKSASFATLPDVIDRFMQAVSGASGVPMTRLFGMSPGGLNASGDGDTRAYYDRVKFSQSAEMTPAMAVMDDCLIRSALGARPPEVHYNWRPLWQPTAKERADIGKVQAETAKILTEIGAPDEPVIRATINAITESAAMPGLEGAMDEYYGDGGFDRDAPETDED